MAPPPPESEAILCESNGHKKHFDVLGERQSNSSTGWRLNFAEFCNKISAKLRKTMEQTITRGKNNRDSPGHKWTQRGGGHSHPDGSGYHDSTTHQDESKRINLH